MAKEKESAIFSNQGENSSDEEDPIVDEDTCNKTEIELQFKSKYLIASEKSVSLKNNYALCLCKDRSFSRIATGMSDGTVQLFDVQSLTSLLRGWSIDKTEEDTTICGVKFIDDNNFLVGRTNGDIALYDLRTKNIANTFEDKTDDKKKTISCFDINSNERVICAGTDQILHDSFLLFFDIRQKSLLGGYWESHQDDVTCVKFHPNNSDLLISGSTDGLVNIFDISKPTEDDALESTLNTDSSVHKLNWHKDVYHKDIISCITHTNDLKFYEAEEGDMLSEFPRSKVTTSLKRKFEGDCNLIDCHNLEDRTVFLLAGSNFKKGEVLRSLKVQNKHLLPLANYEGNKQIIRDSVYDMKTGNLVTSGESGIVTVWSEKVIEQAEYSSTKLKDKTKGDSKIHKKKPYYK